MYTRQTAFSKALRGLLKQGSRSTNAAVCLYRGPDGKKCAMGMLIPDKLYEQSFEGLSAHRIAQHLPRLFSKKGVEAGFYADLQWELHDIASDWRPFTFRATLIRQATAFAKEHDLKLPKGIK